MDLWLNISHLFMKGIGNLAKDSSNKEISYFDKIFAVFSRVLEKSTPKELESKVPTKDIPKDEKH